MVILLLKFCKLAEMEPKTATLPNQPSQTDTLYGHAILCFASSFLSL